RCRIEPALIGRAVLGKRPLPAKQALIRAPHPLADLKFCGLRPQSFDSSRQVAADDERFGQLPVIRPVAEIGVDRIHRYRADPHQNFSSLRIRLRQIAKLDRPFRRPGGLDIGSFHRLISWLLDRETEGTRDRENKKAECNLSLSLYLSFS